MAGIYTSKFSGEEIDILLDKAKESGSAADVSQLRDDVDNLIGGVGYYICSSPSDADFKVIPIEHITLGASFKVKMTYANTAQDAGFELAPLGGMYYRQLALYNGKPITPENTWKDGEVIEVYVEKDNYGAYHTYCKPWQGGSNVEMRVEGNKLIINL